MEKKIMYPNLYFNTGLGRILMITGVAELDVAEFEIFLSQLQIFKCWQEI